MTKTMSKPKGQQQEQMHELELDLEVVHDLDVDPQAADAVRGGPCIHSDITGYGL